MLSLVEVFGRGRVATTFIQGLEMAQPYDFKTEDEGAKSHLEGDEWMLAHGISPAGYPMRCVPGTEFAGMYPPRTEYHLRIQLARSKMFPKYDVARINPHP
ncbi:MAG: hypothetical protein Q7R39_09825 [Dehalococcoidia bacterium]|nr:hypothetical protein [Dehalococcoidia bacterium]